MTLPIVPRPAPPRRGHRTALLVAGAVALVAAASAGTAVILRGNTNPPDPSSQVPATIIVTGTLTLSLLQTGEIGQPCTGSGSYGDLRDGTQVTVYDSAGNTVALGELDGGQLVEARYNMACQWSIRVPDVPAGKGIYAVEVAHRGKTSYTEAQLRGQLRVELGG